MERSAQFQPGTLAVWNFDSGPGRWGKPSNCEIAVKDGVLSTRPTAADPNFSTPVNATAGGKALVLRYRAKSTFTLQVYWSDAAGSFADVRHLDYSIPAASGDYREIVLPFACQNAFSTLRLDPETGTNIPLEIDAIVLRHFDPDEYRQLANELLIEPELTRMTREIAANPMSTAKYSARGNLLIQLGRWREAAEDFTHEQELTPTSRTVWFKVANCLLLAGDETSYQQLCLRMVEQFRGTSDPQVADSVCKTCLLRPGTIELPDLPISMLRDAIDDPKQAGNRNWFVACCALICYREGNYEQAIEWTKKNPTPTWQTGALALVVRALAEHQLGQHEQASQTLKQAETMIPTELRSLGTAADQVFVPVPLSIVAHDWLTPEILRREAEKLIRGNRQVQK